MAVEKNGDYLLILVTHDQLAMIKLMWWKLPSINAFEIEWKNPHPTGKWEQIDYTEQKKNFLYLFCILFFPFF